MKFTREVITPSPNQRRKLYRKKVLGTGRVGELKRVGDSYTGIGGKRRTYLRAPSSRLNIANTWLATVAGFMPGDRFAMTCPKPGVLVLMLIDPPKFEVKAAPEQTQIPAWKQPCPICGIYRTIHNPGKASHERGAGHLNAIARAKAELQATIENATAAVPG